MQIGDRVRIRLKEITDNIERSIDGQVGILESNNLDPYVPYDYCVRVGGMIFGINDGELEEIEDEGCIRE